MNTSLFNQKKYKLGILLLLSVFMACKKNPADIKEVYNNNFEQTDLSKISGGLISLYNFTNVLGFYNNDGFKITLNNLEQHELVIVSFDLYIHDSWSGNSRGPINIADGPDIWEMKVDEEPYIRTTFSNTGDCNGGVFCLQQSYPKNFPFSYDIKTGAFNKNLPGVCLFRNMPGGTSLYKIEKTILHKKGTLIVEFKDELKQSNAINPLCDESWSLDNLVVKISTFK